MGYEVEEKKVRDTIFYVKIDAIWWRWEKGKMRDSGLGAGNEHPISTLTFKYMGYSIGVEIITNILYYILEYLGISINKSVNLAFTSDIVSLSPTNSPSISPS